MNQIDEAAIDSVSEHLLEQFMEEYPDEFSFLIVERFFNNPPRVKRDS